MKQLEGHGVGYGVYYPIPVHKQPLFRDYNDIALPNAEEASARVVSIPVHPGLTEDERDLVVQTVNGYE